MLVEFDGKLYVQRPTSWAGGWARHLILRRHFDKAISIVSPETWDDYCAEGKLMCFLQYEDGTWSVN